MFPDEVLLEILSYYPESELDPNQEYLCGCPVGTSRELDGTRGSAGKAFKLDSQEQLALELISPTRDCDHS
jgi:hypothetical protein